MFFIHKPKKPRKNQNNKKNQSWATLQPDWEHRPKSCPGLFFLVFLVILVFPSFFLVFLWKTLVLLSLFWFVYGKHWFCLIFFWFLLLKIVEICFIEIRLSYGLGEALVHFFNFLIPKTRIFHIFAKLGCKLNHVCVNVYKFRNSYRNTIWWDSCRFPLEFILNFRISKGEG